MLKCQLLYGLNRQFKDFAPLALSADPWEFSRCCNNQEQFLLLQDDGKARSVNNNKVNKLQSVDTNVHTLPLYKDSTQKELLSILIISLSQYARCNWSIQRAVLSCRFCCKSILLQDCFVIYRQLFLTFIASKNLKLVFTLNYVLKRANDSKTISN